MSHDIEIRKIPFEFLDGANPVWHPEAPEWSHMVNGASLTMPYLEPFLIKNLREAQDQIDDPELREDIRGFIGQEAQHFTNHRRYNEFLKQHGYPTLSSIEAGYERSYEALSQRSLAWRLAYTAGFETMTMGVTEWLVNDRDKLFKGADPVVTSLVLWHMVEETEHKSVAYDVYQAVSGRYWLRLVGLVYGSMHVGFLSRRAYISMLKTDGNWWHLPSRLRLWKMVGAFFFKVGAAMVRSINPKYHPDRISDPIWIAQWRDAFGRGKPTSVPVLRTDTATIEPHFVS